MKSTICAVIVTYNRKKYLINAIDAIREQSKKVDAILIFDNCSNDGTRDMLYEKGLISSEDSPVEEINSTFIDGIKIYYYRNSMNSGGSGGFNQSMKIAYRLGFDYLWCMDDDVLPELDCLEKLYGEINGEVGICIPSRSDDRFNDHAIVENNMSNPFRYMISSRKKYIFNESIEKKSIDVVDMPFEGPLISRDLIEKIGFPKEELFIIFDDTEYAYRAIKYTKIKYVKVATLHKQIIPTKGGNSLMGWKEYYGYRNQIWFDRTYGENIFVRVLRPRLLLMDLSIRSVAKGKWSNLKVLKKAYNDGMHGLLGKQINPGTKGEDF